MVRLRRAGRNTGNVRDDVDDDATSETNGKDDYVEDRRDATTKSMDANGRFVFPFLIVGEYRVKLHKSARIVPAPNTPDARELQNLRLLMDPRTKLSGHIEPQSTWAVRWVALRWHALHPAERP